MKIAPIKINKEFSDKFDFLKYLILKKLKYSKIVYTLVENREKLEPTILEYGFALPHVVYDKAQENRIYFIKTDKELYWGLKHAESINKLFFVIARDRETLNIILSKLALFIEKHKGNIDEKMLQNYDI